MCDSTLDDWYPTGGPSRHASPKSAEEREVDIKAAIRALDNLDVKFVPPTETPPQSNTVIKDYMKAIMHIVAEIAQQTSDIDSRHPLYPISRTDIVELAELCALQCNISEPSQVATLSVRDWMRSASDRTVERYVVSVVKVAYTDVEIEVKARNDDEARALALEIAPDLHFPKIPEYEFKVEVSGVVKDLS